MSFDSDLKAVTDNIIVTCRFKLIVASNRDEFLDREADPLHFWNDAECDIVAGTDKKQGGTWLGSLSFLLPFELL